MSAERRTRSAQASVLVVDDEEDLRELLAMTLVRMGLHADCVGTLAEARDHLQSNGYQLCLTDMRLPDGEGLELVQHIAARGLDLPVAVITAYGSMDNAVTALKAGAFDYLAKPVSIEQLRALIRSALRVPEQSQEDAVPERAMLVGESAPIRQARELIGKLARSLAPVYISGESGSGKERAARLIHAGGARTQQAFVAVNCGALPEALMESEFFGYRKGAFTGADADRDGFFHAANGGTLFLDEVGDLPLSMQVKLLRAIQEKKVRKVGATQEDAVDVRLICATHRDLKQLVEAGQFRQDLYYRLNVIQLHMPSLRECREDIPGLVQHVLQRLAREQGLAQPELAPGVMAMLQNYPFPGNVRELENTLERALALSGGGLISQSDLMLVPADHDEVVGEGDAAGFALEDDSIGNGQALQDYLDAVERKAIEEALQKTRFNRTAAAKLLGVTFRSLRYRMERLGLND